ncbi:MAG TPA: DUF2069 domain-containing protein [Casimicrobiaceae bacterium]|nr:DUF2069 domain-containing protein [Casimicrobiaceae bacterium]
MTGPTDLASRFARATFAGLLALVALEVLWETALAPLRAGGGWLALKALPIALLLPGVARGARRPRQWLSLLLPWYAAEGIVRAWSETGRHAMVAATVAVIAVATFACVLAWFRVTAGERRTGGAPRG